MKENCVYLNYLPVNTIAFCKIKLLFYLPKVWPFLDDVICAKFLMLDRAMVKIFVLRPYFLLLCKIIKQRCIQGLTSICIPTQC